MERLTPRVGDRVLVNFRDEKPRTYVGQVMDIGNEGRGLAARVMIDGQGLRACWLTELTVVDREPVEWPEGWSRTTSDSPDYVDWHHGSYVRTFSKTELIGLQRDIPDMLARWDELMGEQ